MGQKRILILQVRISSYKDFADFEPGSRVRILSQDSSQDLESGFQVKISNHDDFDFGGKI